MSFDNTITAFKAELEKLTYTDIDGVAKNVNVYRETEILDGKASYPTPALIIRGVTMLNTPITIGWGNFSQLGEFTVSLYLKQRASDYSAIAVKEELTTKIIDLAKTLKDGIGDAEYLRLINIIERDWVEKPGILRRDFVFEVYKEV